MIFLLAQGQRGRPGQPICLCAGTVKAIEADRYGNHSRGNKTYQALKGSVALPGTKSGRSLSFLPLSFLFLILFFFLFFSSSFFHSPPSTPPFLMGFGPSLTKDDSQFSDKASRGRTWIAIIWYSWWNSWLKVISFVLTLQTQTESKHMTLSGKHYWTINVCLNVTRSPEVSPVTQLRFFFSMLTFILSVILSSYTQAACLKNEESSQRLLGRSTINGREREFAEKIGIKINIDVCRLIRATAQNGCPSEDRAAVMGGSFCSH